ncbi:hypothetical protein PGT21_019520 [Puccinia graminis f. sp. tritici]|uniref:Uncharacterized protein n=1 Tax=Puccinia graminis f. sp. tritici TaxID=56615 RepID=A0A5B0PXY1_PUCGR|nr:hypothetical protein PGT21_019520 [Puccinia graminis f. sp. tritici]
MKKHHQNLVQVNKDHNIQKSARRATFEVLNNEVTIGNIDATNQLEPVIGINDKQYKVNNDGSGLDKAKEIPPGTFGEAGGELDEEEAKLSWMDFVDVAVYQTSISTLPAVFIVAKRRSIN